MEDRNKLEQMDNIDFNKFKEFALDNSLNSNEKIGFLDSYRKGFEEYILEDILSKLNLKEGSGKVILDIGCGCGDLVLKLIDHTKSNNQKLILIDSEEMLSLLPNDQHLIKIAGEFPFNYDLLKDYVGHIDSILAYSVLHYVFEEGNIYKFIDKSCQLLKSGGGLLLGDIPNYTKRTRFFMSERGIQSHRDFVGDQTSSPSISPYSLEDRRIDDGVVFGILHRYRTQGFETYLLPLHNKLPLANRREDILIEKR